MSTVQNRARIPDDQISALQINVIAFSNLENISKKIHFPCDCPIHLIFFLTSADKITAAAHQIFENPSKKQYFNTVAFYPSNSCSIKISAQDKNTNKCWIQINPLIATPYLPSSVINLLQEELSASVNSLFIMQNPHIDLPRINPRNLKFLFARSFANRSLPCKTCVEPNVGSEVLWFNHLQAIQSKTDELLRSQDFKDSYGPLLKFIKENERDSTIRKKINKLSTKTDQNSVLQGLKKIFKLDLSGRNLKNNDLPSNLTLLDEITHLNLSSNSLTEIPPIVYKMNKLKVLNLISNKIKVLPANLSQMKNLKRIQVLENPIKEISLQLYKQIFELPYLAQWEKS